MTEQAHLFYGDEEGIRAVGETVPLGRMADPTDVADVCLFLASPLARYVTRRAGARARRRRAPELHAPSCERRNLTSMTGRLEGKVALVTGAASGIGAACARRFADEGARVAGIDIAVPDDASVRARSSTADVRDADAWSRPRSAASSRSSGAIDVLVNAAGVSSFGTADTIDEAEWDRVLDINLKGTWLVARAVLPGHGRARAAAAS